MAQGELVEGALQHILQELVLVGSTFALLWLGLNDTQPRCGMQELEHQNLFLYSEITIFVRTDKFVHS